MTLGFILLPTGNGLIFIVPGEKIQCKFCRRCGGRRSATSRRINRLSEGRNTSYGHVLGAPNVIDVCVVET